MTLPTLILGFIISTMYGALFHLFRGGGPARLLFYLCLGWAGFWIGQVFATRLGWTFAKFGPIHLGAATLGSLIFLLIGYWLSLVKVEKR
jgi:uncharacterized membrane protein YeaQ/YmgE (transglycosylase-associated protein family)